MYHRTVLIIQLFCSHVKNGFLVDCGFRYCYGELVEINSHSLFSKWFSEVSNISFVCTCSFHTPAEWQTGTENVQQDSQVG